MARTRQLKHDFFLNEDLAALDPLTRLLFQGLWLLADREGRLEDRPARIKAQIFPYHEADVDAMLNSLSGFLVRYSTLDTTLDSGLESSLDSTPNSCLDSGFIQIINFKKHQHIHPDEKQSTIPEYRGIPGDFKRSPEIKPSSSSPSTYTSSSLSNSPKRIGPARPVFVPPKIEEVKAYCAERSNGIDAEEWMAYYEARGWKFKGGQPMKNWKAAMITWEKKGFRKSNANDRFPGADPVWNK